MIKVRVTNNQVRNVPVYRYEFKKGRNVRTKDVVRVDEVTNKSVIFSGSETAFDIWKKGHTLPAGAEVERRRAKRYDYEEVELAYADGIGTMEHDSMGGGTF
jgi:hypothetical protein